MTLKRVDLDAVRRANPTAPDPTRKAQLAAIHVLKKQAGLDDAAYRDYLEIWTGKRSSGDMSPVERGRVMDYLRVMTGEKKKPTAYRKDDELAGMSKQQRYAAHLWRELHELGAVQNKSVLALSAYAKRMLAARAKKRLTEEAPSHIRFATTAQCSYVIEALKKWLERVKKDAADLDALAESSPTTPAA